MPPKHVLVFRFSSLGDIAMTVPVVRLLLQQHKHLQVTFVSVPFVKPLFESIERLHFAEADLKGRHKGFIGLFRLYKDLSASVSYDAIADLHNVLRTQILRIYFGGKKMAAINKGRKEKKAMTRQHNKVLKPLKSTFQRYADVFSELNLPIQLIVQDGIEIRNTNSFRFDQSNPKHVGIAPFARYEEKIYPVEKMRQVIHLLLREKNIRIILFGGKDDAPVLQEIANENENISSVAASFSFQEQLNTTSGLDVMVSMDSANMHLASLYGIPVVSVWGGTHPFLGFLGWGQSLDNCVQIDLECRPSSMFGNKTCPNHFACMNGISPLWIAEKVLAVLGVNENT